MLTRIYLDNILCFTNLELCLEPLAVLLGDNGSGKTSIIELIDSVRRFVVDGLTVDQFAPSNTLTRWDTRNDQRIILTAEVQAQLFEYELVITHTDDRLKRKVLTERLSSGGDTLFLFDEQATAHLYNDSGIEEKDIPLDWSRSSLGWIREGPENKRLARFRQWLKQVQLVRPDPRHVEPRSEQSKSSMEPDLRDFPAWLRGHFETGPQGPAALDQVLKGVLEGFDTLLNENLGGNLRRLQARFRALGSKEKREPVPGKPIDLAFDELSDGQRQLVMLYALLMLELESGKTLLIDEPDNFLALAEIQPWLNLLQDRRKDKGGQVILVSHHPEVLNQVALAHGTWLWRDSGGPVRARPFRDIAEQFKDTLTCSEIIARGWTRE